MTTEQTSVQRGTQAGAPGAYAQRDNAAFEGQLAARTVTHDAAFLLPYLHPGMELLDVGCGSGRYCIEMAKAGAKEVVGVDISPKMLEIAKQLAVDYGVSSRCQFLQKDVLDIQNSFDDAIAMGFFDYVQKPELVFSHLRTIVCDKFIASFPAISAPRATFRKCWLTLRGCPVYFYSKSEINLLCRRAGFVCNTLIKRGPIYLLVAVPDLKSSGQI